MSETLGKIEKPEAEGFKLGRKLIFVPLVFLPPDDKDPELVKLVKKFWSEAGAQVKKLSGDLAGIARIYHELVPGGEEGLKTIKELHSGSYELVKKESEGGAVLEQMEDLEVLAEYLDWGRCLSLPLESPKVFNAIYENYTQAQKKRVEAMSKKIDESLKTDELGLVLLREGHHVQFSPDIQVFYVSPPGLDALARYVRERMEKPPAKSEEPEGHSKDGPAPGETG
jgi:hypothetical protein